MCLQLLDLTKAEYNRVLNKDLDDTELREIVWNAMDTASTYIASDEQLDNDAKNIVDLYKHIVKRHKLKYNTLDVKAIGRSKGNNDMEIGLVKEGEGNVEAPICEQCASNDLDGFQQGRKRERETRWEAQCVWRRRALRQELPLGPRT